MIKSSLRRVESWERYFGETTFGLYDNGVMSFVHVVW